MNRATQGIFIQFPPAGSVIYSTVTSSLYISDGKKWIRSHSKLSNVEMFDISSVQFYEQQFSDGDQLNSPIRGDFSIKVSGASFADPPLRTATLHTTPAAPIPGPYIRVDRGSHPPEENPLDGSKKLIAGPGVNIDVRLNLRSQDLGIKITQPTVERLSSTIAGKNVSITNSASNTYEISTHPPCDKNAAYIRSLTFPSNELGFDENDLLLYEDDPRFKKAFTLSSSENIHLHPLELRGSLLKEGEFQNKTVVLTVVPDKEKSKESPLEYLRRA